MPSHTISSSVGGSIPDRLLDTSLRVIIAVWLMVGFVLPNTPLGQVSVASCLPDALAGPVPVFAVSTAAGVCLVVWLLLKPLVPSRPAALLWWLTLTYAASITAFAFLQRKTPVAANSAFLLLATFAAGLTFARVCGGPKLTARVLCGLGTVQACCTVYDRFWVQTRWASPEVLRAGGTFGHPTGVYTVMLFCLPPAVALAVAGRTRSEKIVWAFASVLMFMALILTWYRGGLLAAAVGLMWLYGRTARRKKPALLLGGALVLVLFTAVYVRSAGRLHALGSDGTLQSRYVLWQEGWHLLETHWPAGVGVTGLHLPMHSDDDGVPADQVYPDPHNLPLFWLDEMGVGGGLLFLAFLMCIAGIVRRSDAPLAVGLGAAWLAVLVAGMFDTPFGLGTKDRAFANALSGALLGATLLLARPERGKEETDAALSGVHAG